MAMIDYPVGADLAKKLWSRMLIRESIKDTSFDGLYGKSEDSVIQLLEDTKEGGDRVRVPLMMQASGRGTTEAEVQEGNEEGLVTYYDDLIINEIGNAVRVQDQGTIVQQRVPFDLREQCRVTLRDWFTNRWDDALFNQLCGYTPVTDTIYSGFNATVAPSATAGNTRWLFSETGATADADLDSTGDEFVLSMIDKAIVTAKTATPRIRPARIKGYSKRMFVSFLHPYQTYQLRQGALGSTMTWAEIQKALITARGESDNPIFTGDRALGIYNNTLLLENPHVTNGAAGTTPNTNVRRAVFCGAQAAVLAFGKGFSTSKMKWTEKEFDYEREFGVRAATVAGIKATRFNSIDFGKIVLSSYSPAPT